MKTKNFNFVSIASLLIFSHSCSTYLQSSNLRKISSLDKEGCGRLFVSIAHPNRLRSSTVKAARISFKDQLKPYYSDPVELYNLIEVRPFIRSVYVLNREKFVSALKKLDVDVEINNVPEYSNGLLSKSKIIDERYSDKAVKDYFSTEIKGRHLRGLVTTFLDVYFGKNVSSEIQSQLAFATTGSTVEMFRQLRDSHGHLELVKLLLDNKDFILSQRRLTNIYSEALHVATKSFDDDQTREVIAYLYDITKKNAEDESSFWSAVKDNRSVKNLAYEMVDNDFIKSNNAEDVKRFLESSGYYKRINSDDFWDSLVEINDKEKVEILISGYLKSVTENDSGDYQDHVERLVSHIKEHYKGSEVEKVKLLDRVKKESGIRGDVTNKYFDDVIQDYLENNNGSRLQELFESNDVFTKTTLELKLTRVIIDSTSEVNPDKVVTDFPSIKVQLKESAIKVNRFDLLDAESFTNLRLQAKIEQQLRERLEHFIDSNAPPSGFERWADFVATIPEGSRRDFILRLLNKHSAKSKVVDIIAQLEPGPGVNEGIWAFFREGNGNELVKTNSSEFSHRDLKKMMGGNRFSRFYPHVYNADVESGARRTKFILANYLFPSETGSTISLRWLREKAHDTDTRDGIPQVIGFRPAFTYERLTNQITDYFSRGDSHMGTPQNQIKGLIVQGNYQNSNFSLMPDLNNSRGQGQVEETIPRLIRRTERSLSGGALADADDLAKRLFVYQWGGLSSNTGLINTVRQEAIEIASMSRRFWDLRVEIHNFPTASTLNRVKRFRDNQNNGDLVSALDSIISNIESLLGVNSNSQGSLNSLIDQMPTSDSNIEKLKEMSLAGDNSSVKGQLDNLVSLRNEYKKMKDPEQSESSSPRIDRYIGDRSLSQFTMKVIADAVSEQRVPTRNSELKSFISLVNSILDHVTLDDMLTELQANNYKKMFDQIMASDGLSFERKRELIVLESKNIIDQVYFKLEGDYGHFDEYMYHLVDKDDGTPVRFIDDTLRSSNIFLFSKLVDKMDEDILASKNLTHKVNGQNMSAPVEVFNPGNSVGVLRFDKNPMELKEGEIAVFSEVPEETGALDGIITLGVGARLSHLQLLAKSLGIPNSKVSSEYLDVLKELDGKTVRYESRKDGTLEIEEVKDGVTKSARNMNIEVPQPDHGISSPITFSDSGVQGDSLYAGPKGIQLSKMFVDRDLGQHTPDGFILPFGFFNRYAESIGITKDIERLSKVELSNEFLVTYTSSRIRDKIFNSDIPDEIIDEVIDALENLKSRTGHEKGYFFRSDTNIEDLPGFNGAGLNESVANVNIDREAVAQALKQVWFSAFKEKSIFWRAMALPNDTVSIAEPSIVVMPTVDAESSGVILSKGGDTWNAGHGLISSNWGIGSVVEAGKPVEEITLEDGTALHYALTVSNKKPVANNDGGLNTEEVTAGEFVLSKDLAERLNKLSIRVEGTLGEQEHGWDIEWAVDTEGRIILLQARPNM